MDLNNILNSLNEELNETEEKWMDEVDDDNSLRRALGVEGEESIMDVSNSKIKDAIKSHGTDFERKLIAYANMVGTHEGQKYKDEKERILKLVRNTKNKESE